LATQQPLVISPIPTSSWIQRLIATFPWIWGADTSWENGGVWYALFYAYAVEYAFLSTAFVYAWTACRLDTCTDIELDLFAEDYFGDMLPRKPNETDASYRARIKAQLLQPQVTRPAITNILQALTGHPVRLLEPWNTGDTGGYGYSYYNADSIITPARYGNPGLRYHGAIDVQFPEVPAGPIAQWGYDAGAGYFGYSTFQSSYIYTGVYWIPFPSPYLTRQDVINTILFIVAFGTVIGLKFVYSVLPIYVEGGFYPYPNQGPNGLQVIAPLVEPYTPFVSSNRQITAWWTSTLYGEFTFAVGAPAPTGTRVNWLLLSEALLGVRQLSVPPAANSMTINFDTTQNELFISPNWNTTYAISAIDPGVSATITFGNAAPDSNGLLSVLIFANGTANSGVVTIPAMTVNYVLSAPTGDYIPLIMPTWNTAIAISPQPDNTIELTFSVPPPEDSQLYWCTYPLPGPPLD
jgi:hypothetical protein